MPSSSNTLRSYGTAARSCTTGPKSVGDDDDQNLLNMLGKLGKLIDVSETEQAAERLRDHLNLH